MIEFVLAAALLLRDPPGDAVGAGSLTPPTAEQYRNVGSFDLLEVDVPDTTMLSLSIEMGALPNPAGLANGFSNPIIDVYIDAGEGGATDLLPGSQMRMPPGRGWEFAVRITGDGATAYRADERQNGAETAISYPVQVGVDERRIQVSTPFERPEIQGVYAITGVYDPFTQDGWRPLASSPSPWAFSSASQRRPVVDVLARDLVAQSSAIRDGVLPLPRNRIGGAMWMVLMALGLVVAGVGLVLRRMAGASGAVAPEDVTAPTPAPAEVAVVLPTFLPALPPPRTPDVKPPAGGWDDEHREGWMDDADAEDEPLGRWAGGRGSEPMTATESASNTVDEADAEPDQDDASTASSEPPEPKPST